MRAIPDNFYCLGTARASSSDGKGLGRWDGGMVGSNDGALCSSSRDPEWRATLSIVRPIKFVVHNDDLGE